MYNGEFQIGLGSDYIRNTSNLYINEKLITTLVWNNNNYSLFVNGIEINNGSYTGTVKTNNGFWHFGKWSNGDRGYWDGLIDNLKISSAPRSESWISTEYNNQSDANSFFSIGNIEYIPITEDNKITILDCDEDLTIKTI